MSDTTPLPDFSQWKKAIKELRKMDVRPKCSNHEPKSELVRFEEGGISVKTHCEHCGFTMYGHPDSVRDLIEGNTGESILKNG